jgi:hypothetical protein
MDINGRLATIVGVMPRGFVFPDQQAAWMPLIPGPELQRRDVRRLWFVVGRLKDGATLAGARAEMAAIGRALETKYPTTNQGIVPTVFDLPEFVAGPGGGGSTRRCSARFVSSCSSPVPTSPT